ncbi:hypothetical protein NG99_22345 [Erwinia typographi]|uniref:Peptidase S74 domain-containing protein n=1 Tax=Erwinia typographi TaxID=371042 RepID=A0A0A3YRD5_9GAMM|nr:tail fiber domain-containing protein [Erwinia typographi]KGT88044.1 hypothetical protein NG99_22345 [Erwinia typographi]
MSTNKQSGHAVADDPIYLQAANNLSDLTDVNKALINLGLGNLNSVLAGKADLVDGVVEISQGGTGASTKEDAWAALATYGTTEGTAAQGNDARLDTLDGKTGGTISTGINVNATGWGLLKPASAWDMESGSDVDGGNRIFKAYFFDDRWSVQSDFYRYSGINSYRIYTYDPNNDTKVWEFRTDGTFLSPGTVYADGTALTSDKRLKSDLKPVSMSLGDIDLLPVQTYTKISPDVGGTTVKELGLMAQDIEKVIPEIVTEFHWNDEYPDLKMVNYSGLTAWLVGYCKLLKDELQAQKKFIADQNTIIVNLQARLKALDGLDA